jgi:Bacteroidetes VLRF1 release factor/Vms1-associating treble clef domain
VQIKRIYFASDITMIVTNTQSGVHRLADGQLLQRLTLYDQESLSLLRKAYEKAKAEEDSLQEKQRNEIGDNTVPVLPSTTATARSTSSNYVDDSSSDDDDDDFPPHESSDDAEDNSDSSSVGSISVGADQLPPVAEEEEEEETVDEAPTIANPGLPPIQAEASTTNTASSKRKKRQPSSKQQKRQAQIVKQHLSNIVRMSLPLPTNDEGNGTELEDQHQLCIPSSLLSKSYLQTGNVATQAHSLLTLSQKLQEKRGYVVVLLLQSGRFGGGVFEQGKCVVHRAFQQYTVRKGQGKAQSSQDQKRRPKSVGSQLRRSGEQALKEDVRETLEEWKRYIADAGVVFVSCPKTSRATLFGTNEEAAAVAASVASGGVFLLSKDDKRIRKVPFDVGRPTFENVKVVHEVLMDVEVRTAPRKEEMTVNEAQERGKDKDSTEATNQQQQEAETKAKMVGQLAIDLPLTPLHEACRDGNLTSLLDLVRAIESEMPDINQPAGYDCMTPLHFAAASTSNVDPVTAAACVSALLIQAQADPSIMDARGRPAYFLASHDKVREAFRKSRAILGEDFCDWDGLAKVGPPLTDEDFAARKEKEAEKKRRKKARQKEKKVKEKTQVDEMEERRKAEEEAQRQAEEAKRVRDGLSPKTTEGNVCDFCQKVCKGKKRNQMFQRLEYKYCSSDCVNNHKRELMAAAALARFGR